MIRNDVEVVETTRQRLGPVGVWLAAAQAAIDRERQAARRIEELGYGSIWTPEGLAGQGSLRTPIAVVGGDRADRDRHRDSQRVGPAPGHDAGRRGHPGCGLSRPVRPRRRHQPRPDGGGQRPGIRKTVGTCPDIRHRRPIQRCYGIGAYPTTIHMVT